MMMIRTPGKNSARFGKSRTSLTSSIRKLRVLMEGLHFYYRSRIHETKITSTRKLRKACREQEPDKSQVLNLERERERDKSNKERQEGVAERRVTEKRTVPPITTKDLGMCRYTLR